MEIFCDFSNIFKGNQTTDKSDLFVIFLKETLHTKLQKANVFTGTECCLQIYSKYR